MKRFRFAIYGDIWVDDNIDDETLEEEITKNVKMPGCGHQMSVDEVIVEEDEE